MDRKGVLKEAKKLIVAGENEKAKELLEEVMEEGEEDYMILCLAALASAGIAEYKRADELYTRALKIDGKTLTAWQGLSKLYAGGHIKLDKRAVETLDFLLEHGEKDRVQSLKALRPAYLVKLGRFSELKEDDLKTDSTIPLQVLRALIGGSKQLTKEERHLVNLCLEIVDGKDEEVALLKARFFNDTLLHEGDCEWHYLFVPLLSQSTDEWLKKTRLDAIATHFMMKGTVPEEWHCFVEVHDNGPPLIRLLNAICEEDWLTAAEVVDESRDGSVSFTLASLRIHLRDESFRRVSSLVDSLLSQSSSLPKSTLSSLLALKAQSLFCLNEYSVASSFLPLQPSFASVEIKIRISNGMEVPSELWKELDEEEKAKVEAWSLLREGKKDEALKRLDGIEVDEDDTDTMILKAECLPPPSASHLLISSARANPRCSRSFFLLARILQGKAKEKASSLADRASVIQPWNEEYARFAFEMKVTVGGKTEEKTKILERFVEKATTVPNWACLLLTRQYLLMKKPTEAIVTVQRMMRNEETALGWALLGEAYSMRGQLVSSAGAFKTSIEMDGTRDEWKIARIQVLVRSLQMEEAETECTQCLEGLTDPQATGPFLILLTQSLLSLSSKDLSRVPSLMQIATKLESITALFPLSSKLLGDCLILLSRCSPFLFSQSSLSPSWNVVDALSALKMSSVFYSRAIFHSNTDASLWKDLATSLILRYRMEPDKMLCEKAVLCTKRAIHLSENKDYAYRSAMWNLLAHIEQVRGSGPAIVQHCLIRAIELNNKNDEAWLRLGILYMQNGQMSLAHKGLENATKWNPLNGHAWAVWAETAVHSNIDEAEALFRHSLTIHPSVWSMTRFVDLLCCRLSSPKQYFNPSRQLIQMDTVLKLQENRRLLTEKDRGRLAIMAELFGYLKEAEDIHATLPSSIHSTRNSLKEGKDVTECEDVLKPLRKLVKEKTERLKELVESYGIVLDPTVEIEEEIVKKSGEDRREEENMERGVGEGEGDERQEEKTILIKKKKYAALSPPDVYIPLLVAYWIMHNVPLDESFISSLHDLRPRHELIDYFPTQLPSDVDNGIRYIEQDGEEPFRFRHRIASGLFEMLKERREALETTA